MTSTTKGACPPRIQASRCRVVLCCLARFRVDFPHCIIRPKAGATAPCRLPDRLMRRHTGRHRWLRTVRRTTRPDLSDGRHRASAWRLLRACARLSPCRSHRKHDYPCPMPFCTRTGAGSAAETSRPGQAMPRPTSHRRSDISRQDCMKRY